MAATTKLLQLRPKTLPITTTTSTPTSLHFFSSTTPEPNINPSSQPNPSPSPPPQPPRSQSPFSSYFSDVKASLKQPKQQQRNPQSEPPRKPFSFGSSNPTQHTSPPKIASLEEIRKNLSEFRRRSVTPPPPPPPPSSTSSSTLAPTHSPQHISFQELYQRNVASRGEDSNPDEAKSDGRLSFEAIRESLSKLKSSPLRNQGEGSGSMKEFMSLSKFRENLNMRPVDPTAKPSRMVGSGNFPLSVFGDEIKEKEGDNVDAKIMTEFVRNYNHQELGKKLVALRPEKKGDTWFSLEELNERLVKLREMEEKESDSRIAGTGIGFKDLRESLQKMRDIDQEKARKSTS